MRFRKVYNNTNWNIYNNIISNNYDRLNLNVPKRMRLSYSKLISFFPLTKKQEDIFFKLPKYKRAPYLFNHFIKICKQNNINKIIIKKIISLKNTYNDKKNNKLSISEHKDRIMMSLISKDYNSMLEIYQYDKKINNSYNEFINMVILIITSLIDDKYNTIRKNTKKHNLETSQRGIRIENPIIHSKSKYIDIIEEMSDNINRYKQEISEWDKFINNEVDRRFKELITNFGEKKSVKSDKYEPTKKMMKSSSR
jgi:hypothetical protein